MILAGAAESRPSRYAVALRPRTRRPRPRDGSYDEARGEDEAVAGQEAVLLTDLLTRKRGTGKTHLFWWQEPVPALANDDLEQSLQAGVRRRTRTAPQMRLKVASVHGKEPGEASLGVVCKTVGSAYEWSEPHRESARAPTDA